MTKKNFKDKKYISKLKNRGMAMVGALVLVVSLAGCGSSQSAAPFSFLSLERGGYDTGEMSAHEEAAYDAYIDRSYIVMADEEGETQYIKIDMDIDQNPLDWDYLAKNDNGYRMYTGESADTTVGVDVSSHQGDIDWEQVKSAGVSFAMIRIGYRGYGSAGRIMPDDYFVQNIKGAKDAGLKVGVYFYSQAINYDEGVEEANFVLQRLSANGITTLDYPVVFDTESAETESARTYQLSKEEFTNAAKGFCETIDASGFQPMIYSNLRWYVLHLDMTELSKYPWWLAQYDVSPDLPYKIDMWQYTSKGSVPGIKNNADVNIAFEYK